MSDLTEAFARRLIVARFQAGRISQETVADRADLHRTQISLLESGRRMPLLGTFVKLAAAVELPPAELLGPIRWAPGEPSGRFVLEDEGRP
jgi:transcriptional regulator with XRE-family HTH domain